MFNQKILHSKNLRDERDELFWSGGRRIDSRFGYTDRRRKGASIQDLQQKFGVPKTSKIVFTPGITNELNKSENKPSIS